MNNLGESMAMQLSDKLNGALFFKKNLNSPVFIDKHFGDEFTTKEHYGLEENAQG